MFAAWAAFVFLPAVPAQELQRLDELLAQFGRGQGVGQVALSPDGQHLAWVGEDGLRLAAPGDLDKSRRITAAPGGENCQDGPMAWAPDSKALAFFSSCGSGNGQFELYLQKLDGTAPRRLSQLRGYAAAPAFSADGQRIGFLYIEGARRPAGALAAMNAPVGIIGEEGVDVQRVAAVAADAAEPQTPAFLTPDKHYIYEFDWSPDSRALVCVAADPPGENNWWVARLEVQPLGGEPRPLLTSNGRRHSLAGLQMAVPRWSPDGQRIAFLAGLMSDQGSTGGDVWIAPAAGGEPVNLTPGRQSTPVWIGWSGRESLLVTEIVGGASRVVRMHVQAESALSESTLMTRAATIGDGRLSMSLSTSADGTLAAFSSSDTEHAPELFLLKMTGHSGDLKQMSHWNEGVTPAWGRSVSINWMSAGSVVQGWLMLPKGYSASKRYPLIVDVHGGPAAATVPRWMRGVGLTPAIFSALGYFVLQPNPRGSFGQGQAFTQANRKDFGYGDLADILAGLDAVQARFPVDPQRVGLMGWSYGGFMTMFGVTQSARFKAAVAGAGISNWQSYYGQNSIDQWMTPYFGSSVYDDPAIYRRSSPIEFVKQAHAPTLLLVGERDGECPPAQSFEFWHGLKALGVPTRLVVYPGEGHRFAQAAHQRDLVEQAAAWFARYLPPPAPPAVGPAAASPPFLP